MTVLEHTPQSTEESRLRSAMRRNPADPEPCYDLGGLLLGHGRAEEALDCYRQALKLAPGHPQILLQIGNTLSALGRYAEAAQQFRASLAADPAQPAAHYNLGNALRELGQPETAAQAYRAALRLNPADADSHNNLGNVLRETGQIDAAIASYRQALRLNPALHHARMHLLHQRQHICDWAGLDEETEIIRRIVREDARAQISPFAFLSLPGTTAAEQKLCAQQWTANRHGMLMREGSRINLPYPVQAAGKLRIGYLSADFRAHPLTWLAACVMEQHDRGQFEIFGYSYGADDRSQERLRWQQAFDHFRDIRELSLYEAANSIHADGIHILVDLTGYTQSSRSGILALRPAPIQVNWLGFPGSMGAPFIEYLISDAFITPPGQETHYSERLVLMPHCYQPNDHSRPVAEIPSRAECGLPQHGLVLCCFNQTFKITPVVFDIWMELLRTVPGSVLWLLECNRWAKTNLQREAAARGVEPDRLVFAPRAPIAQHLARHACADLMLDTLPYNAHTTTSDALWMGLPVITCTGDTFASRVAGSLLHAAGLPQLVTADLAHYRALALHLSTHPDELAALKSQLLQQRTSSPLFDAAGFVRHLQLAYRHMWQRHASGLGSASIQVADLC